jgi:uncharacterized protein (TIGR02466 family)
MRNFPVYYDMLWHENFPNECEKLITVCNDLASADVFGGNKVSNIGGYQSYPDIHTMPEFKNIVNIVKTQFTQLHAELELVDQVELEVLNMWFNINTPGSSNSIHSHVNPPSLNRVTSSPIISGTFYVDVPDNSGDLVFHSSRENYGLKTTEPSIVRIPSVFLKNEQNPHIIPWFKIKPENGDLYLWFSDMLHGVETNKSEFNRISISFNVGIKLK